MTRDVETETLFLCMNVKCGIALPNERRDTNLLKTCNGMTNMLFHRKLILMCHLESTDQSHNALNYFIGRTKNTRSLQVVYNMLFKRLRVHNYCKSY